MFGKCGPSQTPIQNKDVNQMFDQDRFRQDLLRLRETITKAGDAL